MLNVQNLYNSAMQKSSSSTSFNIQNALRWKKKGAVCFALTTFIQSCTIQRHCLYFFTPQYVFIIVSLTQGKSTIVKQLFHWKDCCFAFLITL